jgi:toxin ParE1/3/4
LPIPRTSTPIAAEAFLNALEEAATLLSQIPEIGSLRYFDHPDLRGLHYCVLKKFPNYLLFYRLLAAEQIVEIVRIVHGARDLPTLFGKDKPSDPKKD